MLYFLCLKYRFTYYFSLVFVTFIWFSNKEVELHNTEDDTLDPNVAKDSGEGVLLVQYCFFVIEALHFLCLKYRFTYYC